MRNKRGFTLMEALIAASIFGMLSVISATIFMNISQSQRTTDSYSALYEDARVIMETLANEIRNGTVDYEEYFSMTKLNAACYGINRGVYASRFYDPGYAINCDTNEMGQGINPSNLGVEYLDKNGLSTKCAASDKTGVSLFSLSVDKDMGKNTFKNGDAESAMDSSTQDELYLISKDGRSKTVIARQTFSTAGDFVISVLRMDGYDTDSNGVIDIFSCDASVEDYCKSQPPVSGGLDCKIKGTDKGIDLTDKTFAPENDPAASFTTASPFTPISPLRSSVEKLDFIIAPTEDPYKAFDEVNVQYHPSVTIVMTLKPSSKEKQSLPVEQQNQSITVQTTVAAGLTSRIKTYPPTSNLSWIQEVPNLLSVGP